MFQPHHLVLYKALFYRKLQRCFEIAKAVGLGDFSLDAQGGSLRHKIYAGITTYTTTMWTLD